MNIVVVGAGYFSQFHLDAWARLEHVTLLGVVDVDVGKAASAALRYGCPHHAACFEALADRHEIDLVDIVTPPATHGAIIKAASARGINVVCQKPLAPSFEQSIELVEHATAAAIELIVHENFRFQPWYREIKRRLTTDHRLQPILGASFRLRPGDGRGANAYFYRQPYFREMPRFLVHETLIHLIDTFRYLFGDIEAVTARLRRLNPAIAGEDAGLIILEHRCGFESVIDGNRLSTHRATDRRLTMGELTVDAMGGVLTLDGDGDIGFRPHEGPAECFDYVWRDRGFGGDCVFSLCQHVAAHFLRASPVENDAKSYLRNLAVEEAVYASHAEGRRITITDFA